MKMGIQMEGSLSTFLNKVGGEIERKVTRSTAYAGAKIFYEEARLNVPVKSGTLFDAIYHAYADTLSGEGKQVYRVSWNYSKAPHGHLIEWGHWRTNKVFYDKNGVFMATSELLPMPVWVPPRSFIGKAYDAAPRALAAMQARSVQRLNEVIDEASDGS